MIRRNPEERSVGRPEDAVYVASPDTTSASALRLPESVNLQDRLRHTQDGVPSDGVPPDTREAFDLESELCLNGRINALDAHAIAGGGNADVWRGSFENRTVAIKVPRPFTGSGSKIQQSKLLKRLWREYLVWSSLSHPNVLEFLGFSYDFCPKSHLVPSLISPWMSNGTVPSYLEQSPETDRLELLVQVAEGLSYLHTRDPPVIHGDLRAGNILVSDSGVPCLSDFGLSRVLSEDNGMTTSAEIAGSLRWMSPELFRAESRVSAQSDVWAFGMTVLEVLTGQRPYSSLKNEIFVLGQINKGRVPPRPDDATVLVFLTDEIWALCHQCWSREPNQRPPMQELTLKLREGRSHGKGKAAQNIPSLDGPLMSEGKYSTNSAVEGSSLAPHNASNVELQPSQPGRQEPVAMITSTATPWSSGSLHESQISRIQPSSNVSPLRGEIVAGGSLRDIAGLVDSPDFTPLVTALFDTFELLEKVKILRNECKELHKRCIKLLVYLRDNRWMLREMDYATAMDAVSSAIRSNIMRISRTIQSWASWGKITSMFRRSDMKSSLVEMNKGLAQCFTILQTLSQAVQQDAPVVARTRLFRLESSVPTYSLSAEPKRQASTSSLIRSAIRGPALRHSSLSHRSLSDSDDSVSRLSLWPIAVSGYANVWEGAFRRDALYSQKVAIKGINTSTSGQVDLLKRMWEEYRRVSRSHPNVLQPIRLSFSRQPYPALSLISPWMSNGTVVSYLKSHPNTDRLELLLGIAEGLSYLHTRQPPITHGDVKAEEILVSEAGVPCLSSFRISPILNLEGTASAPQVIGSLRWTSPELLREDDAVSPSSDVWAYGMTVLEIISGDHPYGEVYAMLAVYNKIKSGELPMRPKDKLPDEMWAICQQCWTVQPMQRPSMNDVLPRLRDIVRSRAHALDDSS